MAAINLGEFVIVYMAGMVAIAGVALGLYAVVMERYRKIFRKYAGKYTNRE